MNKYHVRISTLRKIMLSIRVGDVFVWAKSGLKETGELAKGDKILGIDREGRFCWSEIGTIPSDRVKEKLIRILLDRCEITVSSDCELCKHGETLQANKIRIGDRLEVFSEPAYILNEVSSDWKTKLEDEIYIKQYGLLKLTPRTNYLLGILSQRTEVPVLWSRGTVVVKTPAAAAEMVANELRYLLPDFDLTDIRGDEYWSWIEFRSDILRLVRCLPPAEDLVSLILNSSFPLLHSFVKGFTFARTITNGSVAKIVTMLKETKLRRVLYNLLFLHSIDCMTSPARRFGEYNTYIIHVASSDLEKFKDMKITCQSLSGWTTVKEVTEVEGTCYLLPYRENNFCSPVVDLVVLA